jgi:hypothetical protein
MRFKYTAFVDPSRVRASFESEVMAAAQLAGASDCNALWRVRLVSVRRSVLASGLRTWRRFAGCVVRFGALSRPSEQPPREGEAMRQARGWRLRLLLLCVLVLVAAGATVTRAAVSPPSPGGFADGAFCTHGKGYFSTSVEAAQRIQAGSASAAGSEIFTIGASPKTYRWQKTAGAPVPVGSGNQQVFVDPGVAALMQAVGTGGARARSRPAPSIRPTWARAETSPRRRSRCR